MLTVLSVVFWVAVLLLAGVIGYQRGMTAAWRAMDPTIDELVDARLAATHRAAFHERQARDYYRLWQMWQRTAFQWARQGWPDQRAYIDEQEAKLATNNLLTVTRANYLASRPRP